MINDIRKALLDLIEAERANSQSRLSKIRKVLIGDPYQYPESELPAIAIASNGGQVVPRGTEYDRGIREIVFIVIYPIKNDLGAQGDRVEWDYNLADIIEGSIEDDDDCLIGIIRKNIHLSITAPSGAKTRAILSGDLSIEYAPNERGQSATQEARVRVSYQYTSSR